MFWQGGSAAPEERTRIASTRPVDPEAYGLYAQGRHFWNRRDAEGFEKARELFEQALAIDPGNERRHAALARALQTLGRAGAARRVLEHGLDLFPESTGLRALAVVGQEEE